MCQHIGMHMTASATHMGVLRQHKHITPHSLLVAALLTHTDRNTHTRSHARTSMRCPSRSASALPFCSASAMSAACFSLAALAARRLASSRARISLRQEGRGTGGWGGGGVTRE